MIDETVAETSLGRVEVQFGINRWVVVTVASNTGQEQLGSEGRAVSLVNVAQEEQNTYFVLFSIRKIVIRADAVEFTDQAATQSRSR